MKRLAALYEAEQVVSSGLDNKVVRRRKTFCGTIDSTRPALTPLPPWLTVRTVIVY
jgi:hypothetical protein